MLAAADQSARSSPQPSRFSGSRRCPPIPLCATGEPTMQSWPDVFAVQSYWLDAWQRSILFLDVLRERGNTYLEHGAREVPHVLEFQAELVRDGRTLTRP